MKLKIITIAQLLLLFIFAFNVYAHSEEGSTTFIEMNHKLTSKYHVPVSATLFEVPEDVAPENYLVNKPINFEINAKNLGMEEKILNSAKFTWDYGDGTTDNGLMSNHLYDEPGTYVLKIDVVYPNVTGTQTLQRVLVNILPYENYPLPRAELIVDGRAISEPISDIINIEPNRVVNLSAETTGEIASHQWDLGNGQSSDKKSTSTTYKASPREQYFPILRVKDKNGLIADAYAQITIGKKQKQDDQLSREENKKTNLLKIALVGVITLSAASVTFIVIKRKKKIN